MCWSENVSLMFTVIGAAASAYSYKYINRLWAISMLYFTLMFIHYISYLVILNVIIPSIFRWHM